MTATLASAPARLADVTARISAAAHTAGRDPVSVHLVAVTKTFAADAIAPVLDAGHRIFGENRVQEAKAKWPALRERYPDIELHLIGPLQSNKAKEAVQLFDAIHSIDRPKIAEAIAQETARQGKRLQLFIQVNTGEEPQKAGVMRGKPQTCCASAGRSWNSTLPGSCASRRSMRKPACISRSSPRLPANSACRSSAWA